MSNQLSDKLKNLEDGVANAKEVGLAAARRYTSVVQAFGGVTQELPEESEVSTVMGWFASNFSTLKDFVARAGDFAALSGVINLLSTLEKKGRHLFEDFRKKDFTFLSPAELGEPSKAVHHAGRRFMGCFWAAHGLTHARQLAEARRIEVLVFVDF